MSNTIERELETLLGESPSDASARASSAFDVAAGASAGSIVLFGAGGLGRKTLRGLRQVGVEPLAFADNNPAIWHQKIDGIPVLPPDQAVAKYGGYAVFVVTIWRAGGGHRFDRTQQELHRLGCGKVLPAALLFWKYPGIFLDYYCLGLPQNVLAERDSISEAIGWFLDERSRREFVAQIRWRLHLDFGCLPAAVREEQYFPDDVFKLHGGEVFVDCGAFDGDSVDAFLRRQGEAFRRIIALEPDPVNYRKMEDRVSRYSDPVRGKIHLEQKGVSDFTGPLRFDGEGSLSSAASPNGAIEIECVTLDELLDGTEPTYIKMDIEGAELQALQGARNSLRASASVLAISAYHKQNHLWQVPKLIKAMNPGSQLFLRPHNEECWDTVCYAVPSTRLNNQ